MEIVLAGLIREKCLVYIDDILVLGKMVDEHLTNLQAVLERPKKAELKVNATKMPDRLTTGIPWSRCIVRWSGC